MKNDSFSRFWVVGGFLTLASLFVFIWMIRVQTSPTAKVIEKAGNGYKVYPKTIQPERGNIYDRWGHLLAGNVEVYEIGADLRYVTDPKTIAQTLTTMTGADYATLYARLTQAFDPEIPSYVKLTDFISPEKIKELENYQKQLDDTRLKATHRFGKTPQMSNLDGLLWSAHLMRSYPEHKLGSNILGFYSYRDRDTAQGYFGVEEKYNQLLAGSPITINMALDPYLITKIPDVPPGASLVLTIDRDIQAMAERVLDENIEKTQSKGGTIVIMDPKTGELLAIAVTPRMDPNEYWTYGDVFPGITAFNRAIGTTYEPGSVFKVLTMAAAIDAGKVGPTTPFLDTGVFMIDGVAIRNWDRGAWGPQDMIGCLRHSLNVCLAWVATELGPTEFYKYMNAFGIGHLTGVDLAGEDYYPLSVQGDPNWYPISLGTNSFGQGLAASPMQMITAVDAVANNGKMMAPHVLKSVIESGEEYSNPPQVIGTPITEETAKTLSEMLAQSIEGEAENKANVKGYRIAGKTGTAQIPGGPNGYMDTATNASFVGWGPVDDPRFLVYVWLEQPQTSPWGSVVAAPMFSEVAQNLTVLMDLPPDDLRQEIAKH
jgi:cell division protein FtsI/penicillin-binding protein 2